MRFLMLLVLCGFMSACMDNHQAKTVWDVQGCAYIFVLDSQTQPKGPDDWQIGSATAMGVYRSRLNDKPTCNLGEKNVQNH